MSKTGEQVIDVMNEEVSKEQTGLSFELDSLNLFLEQKKELSIVPMDRTSLLTAEKGDLSEMVSDILQNVNDGVLDAMAVNVFAKKGEYIFKSLLEGIKGKVHIPDGSEYTVFNTVISQRATGVKYLYSHCGDPEWDGLFELSKDIKERMDARQLFLKGVKEPTEQSEVIDEQTGEVTQQACVIKPVVKTGGVSLIFTLK